MMHSRITALSDNTEKWLRVILMIAGIIALLGFVGLVSAGSPQISGLGEFAGEGECNGEAVGVTGYTFANKLSGDLEGCLYVFVDEESATCRPSGTYIETGTEIFVSEGDTGRFSTTYRFTAKFEDCPNFVGQKYGRCQHPIVADSGAGIFEGVSGRLDFKDNIEDGVAVNFPYNGHLNFSG